MDAFSPQEQADLERFAQRESQRVQSQMVPWRQHSSASAIPLLGEPWFVEGGAQGDGGLLREMHL